MKKSTNLNLLVLGTAVFISGCSEAPDDPMNLHQNSYNSVEECKRDWDVKECTPNNQAHHGGTVMPIVGPRYYWDSSSGAPRAFSAETGVSAARTTALTPTNAGRPVATVSRGGFGATASAGHAGSSGG